MSGDLMEWSMVDENEPPGNEDEENYRPPAIVQSPVVVQSILKSSNKDNLIQLFTPKPVNPKLKVKFQTPQAKKVTPTRYEGIRSLDEEENWVERTSVVTKQQHEEYLEYGRDILIELIDNLPVSLLSSKSTDKQVNLKSTLVKESVSPSHGNDTTINANDTIMNANDTTVIANDTTVIGNDTTIVGNDKTVISDESVEDNINNTVIEVPLSEQGDKNLVEPPQTENECNVLSNNDHQEVGQTDHTMSSEVLKNVEKSPALPANEVTKNLEKSPALPAKGSYNLDFDNLDSINPFATKSAVTNSPENINNNNANSLPGDVTSVEESNMSASLRQCDADVSTPAVAVKPSNEDSDSETEFQDALSDVELDNASKTLKAQDTASKSLNKPKSLLEGVSDLKYEKDTLNGLTGAQVAEDLLSENFDDIDPFKPGFIIPNSPLRQNINLYDDDNLESEPGCVGEQNEMNNNTIHEVKLPTEGDKPDQSQQIKNSPEKLDEYDPFKPSKQIVNSPEKLDEYDPFKPSIQIGNSPEKLDEIDPFKSSKQIVNSPEKLDEIDPFKPSKQIVNSPEKLDDIDPFKPSKQIVNSQEKLDEIDPFKPSKQIVNSPEKLDEIDPFKPSKQIVNSPEKLEEIDPFKPSKQIVNSPEKLDEIDPFKPSKQIVNSPEKLDEIDPFKPSKQIVNSPEKLDEYDPFKPSIQIGNSPDKQEEIDPFKPSKQIVNSPEKLDEMDPFKPSKQIVNSPDKQEEIDPFKPSKQIVNSPDKQEEIDPFKPSKQIVNSPEKLDETDPFKPSKQIVNSPEKLDEIDPFKPSKQIVNSPEKLDETDPFKPSKQIVNSPEKLDEIDPFKPSKQIVNSPEKLDEIDPFKPSKQIVNSPEKLDETDPFKPSKQIVNSPEKLDETDPFKPSKQIVNSPDKNTECDTNIDPFKPVKEVMNSSNVKKVEGIDNNGDSHNSKGQTSEAQEMCVLDDNLDPFQSKNMVMNSPSLTGIVDNPFVTKSKVENSPGIKTEPLQNVEPDSEVKSSSGQSVNSVNDKKNVGGDKTADEATRPVIDQGFEVEEDQFQPATNIFNSPSAWDMLEKFGSGSNTGMDLARQSLYVKFDPLVNLPLHDPKRASIGLRRLSMGIRAGMKPEQQKDLFNCEESFLLLGTPPNQKSRRAAGVRPCSLVEEGTPKSKQTASAPVDLLFASPTTKPVQENEYQGSKSANTMLPANEQSESDIIQVLQYTEADMQNLKDAMNLWYQGMLMNKEKEWSKSLNEKEKEKQTLLKKHEKEKQELMKKQKGTSTEYENLMMVVKEYEKMIQQFIDEKEKSKESSSVLKQERDQALEDVRSWEKSFADLHKRFEKLRYATEAQMKNEELLKKCAEDFKNKLVKADEKLVALKKDAETKLARAQQENEQLRAEKEKEHSISDALIKRNKLQIDSLQKSYDQKVNEVKELTNLCEDLMAKVQE